MKGLRVALARLPRARMTPKPYFRHPEAGRSDVPSIIGIDTLNRSFMRSESKDQDMTAFVRAADLIRDAFGCLVIIIHPSPHADGRPRGHSSLMGALDVQIAVHKDANGTVVALLSTKLGESGLQI